jgi:deoxyribonuclease-4
MAGATRLRKLKDRPLLGAHMSTAGGLSNALHAGESVGCEAIQVFTRPSRQWAAAPLGDEEIKAFKQLQQQSGIHMVVAHDSYLLNLGAPDTALRRKSVDAFVDEMKRCEALGIPFLITHPGAHMGQGESAGLRTIARSLDTIHRRCKGYGVRVALEITAGQGTNLGYRFEHIRNIIDSVKESDRLRVCFDTEHAFAAGYDIRTPEDYERTFTEFNELVGIDLLAAFHLNDSKKEFHSRVDRHELIGHGHIGIDTFRLLVNDERFFGLPMCLETPKGKDLKEDRDSLGLLRSLRA